VAVNRGKDFEGIVKDCFDRLPYTYALRLYDPQGGYASVANICDFAVSHIYRQYLIECKTVHGNTLPIYSPDPKKKYGNISNTQWDGMIDAVKHNPCIVAGVLCWWVDRDMTLFLPIDYLAYQRNVVGRKSIRFDIEDVGRVVINGTKKRVYFDYDFESLFNAFEKER